MFWNQPKPHEEEDTTIADFVIIDRNGDEEDEPSAAKIYFWGYFCSPRHLCKVTLIIVSICISIKLLVDWNDIIALYVLFALFLVQLIFAVDKIPGLGLNTRSYLTGPTIPSNLEETRKRTRKFFKGPKRTHYVVIYTTTGLNGKPMVIRKVLQAGVFDDDLPQDNATQSVLTDLACREGAPFSAFPRSAVWKHHLRYRRWMLYFMPIFIVTAIAIPYNLYVSYNVEYDQFHHIERLKPIYVVYAVLYPLVLLPLLYKIRRWKYDVSYGGEEITSTQL
jgi:hypothetical protein